MDERKMLKELQSVLIPELKKLELEIMFSDPFGNDDAFDFLIKKAASYRDILMQIEKRLQELSE